MLSDQDLEKILKAIKKAHELAGKKLQMVELHDEDSVSVVYDNRKEEELQ